MKSSHIFPILFVLGLLLALPSVSHAQINWNFNGSDEGWTIINGFRDFEGVGIEAGLADNVRSHDAAHTTFLFESPEFTFTGGDTLTGGTAIRVHHEGGQGAQGGSVGNPANPAAVLAHNGGNSNSSGLKGVGLLNTGTGNYDFHIYDPGNGGGVQIEQFNTGQLTGGGVDLNAGYKLHIFEHDDGGWGWTRWNQIELDATLGGPAAIPEPASIAIWALIGLGLAGFGYLRFRRKT